MNNSISNILQKENKELNYQNPADNKNILNDLKETKEKTLTKEASTQYNQDIFNKIDKNKSSIFLRNYMTSSGKNDNNFLKTEFKHEFLNKTNNYFVDAMCIPSSCQNKELAERFINYMLSPEPAIANAEFIYYASPNSVVYTDEDYIDEMGEDAMEILYPEIENFSELYNAYAYRSLDEETLNYVNSLWETLKIN